MLINLKSIYQYTKPLIYLSVMCVVIGFIIYFNLFEKTSDRLFLSHRTLFHKKQCTVIVRNPLGRLGNVLFEFASAYGLSLDHSCHLYIGPGFIKELGSYFEINLLHLLTESELNRVLPAKKIYSHCTYFPELLQPNATQNIELVGYWQSQKHFINHASEIRHQLRFKKSILKPAEKFIETNINSNISSLVGIHIRRGDFVGKRKVSSDQFIFDAMAYFKKKYLSVNFILVSDDKAYCRKVFGKRTDTFFTPNSFTAAEDMAILTLCDHAIITVGTYGWWGAFLLHNRTGEVITDSKPDHSALDVDCAASVFFPPWFQFLNSTK